MTNTFGSKRDRIVAYDRDERDACERSTLGCCINHTAERERWVGFIGGGVVAEYRSHGDAELALTRREVDCIAPDVQPGHETSCETW